MKAAVWLMAGEKPFLEEIELSAPGPGEVEVELRAAGVCHSDLHLALGHLGRRRFPTVLGHEGAGVVRTVGSEVRSVAPGDHVAFCFLPACGECRQCRRRQANLCEPGSRAAFSGTMLDGSFRMYRGDGSPLQQFLTVGAFAERTVVPEQSVVKMPPAVGFADAALLGCAVVTGFGAVRNKARVRAGDRVAVIGSGGVGLQVIAAAAAAGAEEIVAVDPTEAKAEFALAQGATAFVPPDGIAGAFDWVFEVVGRPETIATAWRLTAPGGAVVVVGIAPVGADVHIAAIDFASEKSLLGSFYGSGNPAQEIASLAQEILSGAIDLKRTVTHRTDLEGIDEAFERMQRGEGFRTLVEF
ncbi:MAG TPA: alcohol dehydrogenase catalytic domain-containing protein [Acidimicrobiia bacterium]|nr:alcohol dehydrogenase catalytic domain-containing protein [Acidimicrobiia bacterium]